MSVAYPELIIVLAFAAGWLILEWRCRRLDNPVDQRRNEQDAADPRAGPTSD